MVAAVAVTTGGGGGPAPRPADARQAAYVGGAGEVTVTGCDGAGSDSGRTTFCW